MSRTWCTTLEESIVSEYLDGILNRKKKPRPPRSPYETSGRPPSAQRPRSAARPGSARPPSRAKQSDRPKTSCNVNMSGSNNSVISSPSALYRKSGSFGSLTSLNSSQLSVYSANVQGNPGRHYSSKKIIKRVKIFTAPEQFKALVSSSYTDLLERSHSHHLYTSDGTALTSDLYHLLPHNCHLYVYDPTLGTPPSPHKPKIIWTKDGIMVSGAQPKRTTKPHLSARMQKLVEGRKQRIQIYKNGEHRSAGSAHVSEGSLKNMLNDATNVLLFTVNNLFTVEGTKIIEGGPVPHLLTTSHIKGPLWATRGNETFSFLGAYNWCRQEHRAVKKELKINHDKLAAAYEADQGEDKISPLQEKVTKLEDIARNIRDIIVNISEDVFEEEDEGTKFRVKNMPEIKENSRLIGKPNIKVNVFINGKDVEEKVVVIPGGNFKPTLDWFLEECEKAHRNTLGGTTQKTSQVYDSEGNAITKIFDLEQDAALYLSYGEPFSKPKIRNFLDISFFGVTAHKFPDSGSCLIVERPLENDETADPPKMFSLSIGVPASYKLSTALMNQKQKQLKFAVGEMLARQIFDDHLFLQHKSKLQRLIYTTLVANQRNPPGKSNLLSSSQTWLYTRSHELKPKGFPKLSLGVSNHSVFTRIGDDLIEGYMVTLTADGRHSWDSTKEGLFVCTRTGLYLTCLESPAELFVPNITNMSTSSGLIRQSTQERERSGSGVFNIYGKSLEEAVTIPEIPAGEEPLIVALPALNKPESQRWAFKQENIALLGQWKLCEIDNPEWSKECLSWPINSSGSENDKLSWPIEGLLLSRAPSLQEPKSPTKSGSSTTALRVCVRYNGSCDSARHVTAPDLSNMKKDLAIKRRSLDKKRDRQPDTQRWLDKHSKELVPGDQEKVTELEFRLFLDKCGSVLGLTTPPTRLFTVGGEELVSLDSLHRDTEVYVSCGADFETPDGERNTRNKYLYDITHDVNKMKTFCSAIAPTTYVVSVSEVKRHETARLQILTDSQPAFLNDSDSMSDILQIAEVNKSIEDKPKDPSEISIDAQAFHFKSHVCQNENDLGMIEQFPWRNPAFTSGLVKDKLDWHRAHSSGDSEAESDCESVKSIRSNSSVSSVKSKGRVYNQWIYKDCRFFLLENPQYVLCAGVDNGVELVPYDKNSAEQCWTVDEEFIYSSNGQTLTVSQCSVTPPNPVDHAGSKLKIAPFHPVSNGNANQKWEYDQNTGHITAFAGTPLCKSLSAALQAKLCTFAVTSTENAEQPTYIMENPGIPGIPDENTHIYVCGSCATALRDRYTVDKIDSTTFVCSVGYYCSTANLNMKNSLLALGGLDGLQPGKAFGTLYLWESLLGDLRQQTSLKSIRDVVKQTLLLECPNEGLVLVRCYLNGTGPPKRHGALFLARSFEEILRKCLIELKAGRPLSRIFLADGTEIVNFQILLDSDDNSSINSFSENKNVPYKELFVSAGEGFIRPKRPKGVPSLKRRMKMYRELKKLDVMSLQSVSTCRGGSRPPHLPAGYTKHALPVYVTRNGDFTSGAVRVVAHSVESLLETATARLNMPLAARRLYSSSGVEVVAWGEVVRDQALVVSGGEAFVRRAPAKKSKWIQRKLENEK